MTGKSKVVIGRKAFPFRNPEFYPRAKAKCVLWSCFSPKRCTAVSLEQMKRQSLDSWFWGLQGKLYKASFIFYSLWEGFGLFILTNLIIYSVTCSFHFLELTVTLYHLMLTHFTLHRWNSHGHPGMLRHFYQLWVPSNINFGSCHSRSQNYFRVIFSRTCLEWPLTVILEA